MEYKSYVSDIQDVMLLKFLLHCIEILLDLQYLSLYNIHMALKRTCKKRSDSPTCKHLKAEMCRRRTEFVCVLPTLSYTSMQTFSKCKRAYYYNKICGLNRTQKSPALQLGTFTSDLLDTIHIKEGADALHSTQQRLLDKDMKPSSNYLYAGKLKALAMLYAYDKSNKLYGKTQVEWNQNINNVNVKGYADLLTKQTVYEFKYSAFPDSYSIFSTFDQVALYCLALQRDCAILRCFNKSKGPRPFKSETTDAYYSRCKKYFKETEPSRYISNLPFYSEDLSESRLYDVTNRISTISSHLLRSIAHFKKYENIGIFYQERQSCFNQFRCDYYDICESNGRISPYLYTTEKKV